MEKTYKTPCKSGYWLHLVQNACSPCSFLGVQCVCDSNTLNVKRQLLSSLNFTQIINAPIRDPHGKIFVRCTYTKAPARISNKLKRWAGKRTYHLQSDSLHSVLISTFATLITLFRPCLPFVALMHQSFMPLPSVTPSFCSLVCIADIPGFLLSSQFRSS